MLYPFVGPYSMALVSYIIETGEIIHDNLWH